MSGKIKKAFSEIHADESLKRKTFEKITAKPKCIPFGYKLAPAMAIMVLMFMGKIYFTPVSYISIDINPSIELEINTFDRVIEVIAGNVDAEKIVHSVSLKNLNYVDAMELLENTASFAPYKDSYTEITVISRNNRNSSQIVENIKSCGFGGENVFCYSGGKDCREIAEENGISTGKYRAYLELKEVNPDITIEEIRDLPMATIRKMIESGGGQRQSREREGFCRHKRKEFGL